MRKNSFRKASFLASAILSTSLLCPFISKADEKLIPDDLKGGIIVFESKPESGPTKIINFGEDGLIKVREINMLYTSCSTEEWNASGNPERTKEIIDEVKDGLEEKDLGKIKRTKLKEIKAARFEDIPKEYAIFIVGHAERLCEDEKPEVGKKETVETEKKNFEIAGGGVSIFEKIIYGIDAALLLITAAVAISLRKKR